jgi:hypothetical protein
MLTTLPADDPEGQARITAFAQGLERLGWSDGRNLRICDAILPEYPRRRHLGSCANEKPAQGGDIHAEAMAATGRAP